MMDKIFPFSLFKILTNFVFVLVQPSLPSFPPFPFFIHPHLHDQLLYFRLRTLHVWILDVQCLVLRALWAITSYM